MVSREQVEKLLWHYRNVYDSTELLVDYSAKSHRTMIETFRSVCEHMAELEAQLKEMPVK